MESAEPHRSMARLPFDAMRPAAEILTIEALAIRPILERTPAREFDRPTVCDGWSVRDVLAHCGAALTHVAEGTVHGFSPTDNERDVEARRSWPMRRVLGELFDGYDGAATAIDEAGGPLDGIGLGEWMHGGDVREALDEPHAYTSAGVHLAIPLLVERSRSRGVVTIDVHLDSGHFLFGPGDTAAAELFADMETFVRLCGGRRPDRDRYSLDGANPEDLLLFT